MSWSLYLISVCLLHISIKLIGDLDLTFRKACLVGAISLSSMTKGWLNMNQRRTFKYLISKINAESKFLDAVKHLETAVEGRKDVFQQERWLHYLSKDDERTESHRSSISYFDSLDLFNLCSQHRHLLEAEFSKIKSRFCDGVLFEDVESSYKMLLGRYRNVRKQYTNGMLSLHLNGHQV